MGKLHIRPHDINTKSKLFRFFDAHQDSRKIDMWNNMNRHCFGNLSRSIARENKQKCSRSNCQLMAIGSGAYQESTLSNHHYSLSRARTLPLSVFTEIHGMQHRLHGCSCLSSACHILLDVRQPCFNGSLSGLSLLESLRP